MKVFTIGRRPSIKTTGRKSKKTRKTIEELDVSSPRRSLTSQSVFNVNDDGSREQGNSVETSLTPIVGPRRENGVENENERRDDAEIDGPAHPTHLVVLEKERKKCRGTCADLFLYVRRRRRVGLKALYKIIRYNIIISSYSPL